MKHFLQSTAPIRRRAPARWAPLAGATLMTAVAGGAAAQAPDAASSTARTLYVAAGAGGAATQAADAAPSAPRALYVAACASCHGADAQGNPLIDAPALAGLSASYLERQIAGFRQGWRGGHPGDPEGREMRPMVDGFADADLAALAGWLAALPLPAPAGASAGGVEAAAGEAAPGGDPARGRTLYAACAVCHGRSGEGNDVLGAPRLAGQASWYTARQLRKFIEGVRGSHPDDTSGASMRASVADLESGDVADVVAWIETLTAN